MTRKGTRFVVILAHTIHLVSNHICWSVHVSFLARLIFVRSVLNSILHLSAIYCVPIGFRSALPSSLPSSECVFSEIDFFHDHCLSILGVPSLFPRNLISLSLSVHILKRDTHLHTPKPFGHAHFISLFCFSILLLSPNLSFISI